MAPRKNVVISDTDLDEGDEESVNELDKRDDQEEEEEEEEEDDDDLTRKPRKPITQPKIIEQKLVGIQKQKHQHQPDIVNGKDEHTKPTQQPKSWADIKMALMKDVQSEIENSVADSFENGKMTFLHEVVLVVRSEMEKIMEAHKREMHQQHKQSPTTDAPKKPGPKPKKAMAVGANTDGQTPVVPKQRKKRAPVRRLTIMNDPKSSASKIKKIISNEDDED
jgi:hypothetical protein